MFQYYTVSQKKFTRVACYNFDMNLRGAIKKFGNFIPL